MNYLEWIDAERALSNAALTVRAQAVPVNDNGRLKWDLIMPRQNVASVNLREITTKEVRIVAERRAWNATGRRTHIETPTTRELRMVPIEATHKIDEEELQLIFERAGNNVSQTFRNIVGTSVQDRTVAMTTAVYRRVELDTFRAWLTGSVVVRNPERPASTYTASYGFDAARYPTDGTVWTATNAYSRLMLMIPLAQALVGQVQGFMMKRAQLNDVIASAPNPLSLNSAVPPVLSQVEDRLSQSFGTSIQLFANEDTVDPYTGGGFARSAAPVFLPGYVAAIPVGGRVGVNAFAPVLRTGAVAAEAAGSAVPIDINGVSAFRLAKNDNKELQIDVQGNIAPVPNEQAIYVMKVTA